MAKEPAIRSLTIQNLLSFGPEPTTVELRNLNVLIGPNGSGKSNLIEVLGILQNAPKDLVAALSKGGTINEWLWKGPSASRDRPIASIKARLAPIHGDVGLRYRLAFTKGPGFRFEITDERIEEDTGPNSEVYYWIENGRPRVKVTPTPGIIKEALRDGPPEGLNPQLSILKQIRDPLYYPQITHVGQVFEEFRLYRDWEFGTVSAVREPCDASLQNDYLEEDFSNLGVVLDRLLAVPSVKDRILALLQTFYEAAKDLRTAIEGGRVQVRLFEQHLKAGIPLVRLSDGTLRWVMMLAILLNPDPPPLVCIEEPELGLHPDMIHELGTSSKTPPRGCNSSSRRIRTGLLRNSATPQKP